MTKLRKRRREKEIDRMRERERGKKEMDREKKREKGIQGERERGVKIMCKR